MADTTLKPSPTEMKGLRAAYVPKFDDNGKIIDVIQFLTKNGGTSGFTLSNKKASSQSVWVSNELVYLAGDAIGNITGTLSLWNPRNADLAYILGMTQDSAGHVFLDQTNPPTLPIIVQTNDISDQDQFEAVLQAQFQPADDKLDTIKGGSNTVPTLFALKYTALATTLKGQFNKATPVCYSGDSGDSLQDFEKLVFGYYDSTFQANADGSLASGTTGTTTTGTTTTPTGN